jgi:hypothetical protein
MARAPLLVAGMTAFALAAPPQTREIYRALAEDPRPNLWRLAASILLLFANSGAMALIARELLSEPGAPSSPKLAVDLLPRLLPAIIPAGMTFGLALAAREAQIGSPPQKTMIAVPELGAVLDALHTSRLKLGMSAVMCAALTAVIFMRPLRFITRHFTQRAATRRLRIHHVALTWIACLIGACLFPVRGSQLVGPIGIVLLASAGAGGIAASFARTGDRLRLPVLSSVIVLAILLSAFDLTDNHRVELTTTDIRRLDRSVDVFAKWYESRSDRAFYESREQPYPVFIVAASGGGLYAAHHAATVLSRLQDQCPNFAQHVFAISAVSGGSLGAALFSSLAKMHVRNEAHVECSLSKSSRTVGPFERQVNSFMEHDFLSPILGAALFPDSIQRFLPAFTPRFDRARAFEHSLASAWQGLTSNDRDDAWSKPYLKHWSPTGVAPALVLNTSNVEHGYRVAITPFEIIDMGELGNIVPLSNLAEFHRLAEVRSGDSSTARLRDLTLATAVSLSARFPWVLPAGRVQLQHGSARLVDGGYVENSGAETAFDIVQSLGRYYERDDVMRGHLPRVEAHVIAITNLQLLEAESSFGLGELLSPIRAMLSARETRAVVALMRIGRFIELCDSYPQCAKGLGMSSFTLNLYDFNLPLGWLLSPSTKEIVELHSGTASRAGTYLGGINIDDASKFERFGAYVANDDSAACEIVALLQGVEGSRCS